MGIHMVQDGSCHQTSYSKQSLSKQIILAKSLGAKWSCDLSRAGLKSKRPIKALVDRRHLGLSLSIHGSLPTRAPASSQPLDEQVKQRIKTKSHHLGLHQRGIN